MSGRVNQKKATEYIVQEYQDAVNYLPGNALETLWKHFGNDFCVIFLIMKENPLPGRAKRPQNRHAYLLRLWRDDEHSPWRILIQNAKNNEQHNFVDLPGLIAYLEAVIRDDEMRDEE